MSQKLTIKKLSTGTVFRLTATGLFSSLVPIFTVLGVLAYFDLFTLNWEEKPVEGIKALWVGPLMGLFFALGFTVFLGCASAFGLWLYSKISKIEIEYEPAES